MIVPATVTKFSPVELVDALRVAWKSQMGGAPQDTWIAVLAGQVALECANGKRCVQWNVGNYKSYTGADSCEFRTTERVRQPDGSLRDVAMTCSFAAFSSLADGCESFIRSQYLHWSRAWSVGVCKGDPVAYAHALHDGLQFPYYTADPVLYAKGTAAWFKYYMAKLAGDPAPTEPVLPDVEAQLAIFHLPDLDDADRTLPGASA